MTSPSVALDLLMSEQAITRERQPACSGSRPESEPYLVLSGAIEKNARRPARPPNIVVHATKKQLRDGALLGHITTAPDAPTLNDQRRYLAAERAAAVVDALDRGGSFRMLNGAARDSLCAPGRGCDGSRTSGLRNAHSTSLPRPRRDP